MRKLTLKERVNIAKNKISNESFSINNIKTKRGMNSGYKQRRFLTDNFNRVSNENSFDDLGDDVQMSSQQFTTDDLNGESFDDNTMFENQLEPVLGDESLDENLVDESNNPITDTVDEIDNDASMEELMEDIDNVNDDMEEMGNEDTMLDNVEDITNNYEQLNTDEPEIVNDKMVAIAQENITFALLNYNKFKQEVIDQKIKRKVSKEETFNAEGTNEQLAVLTTSTKEFISEVRADMLNVISKFFENKNYETPDLICYHKNKLRTLEHILKGASTNRTIDVDKLYAPIYGAYSAVGSNLNELVNYISNMTMRPIETLFRTLNDNGSFVDALNTSIEAHNTNSNGVNEYILTNQLANNNESIKFITSIIGSLIHYVAINNTDLGIRYEIIETPFSKLDITPTTLNKDEIVNLVNNIIYTLSNFNTVHADVVETLGYVSGLATQGKYDYDVIKVSMAISGKLAKGILHAHTYGINKILDILIAETLRAS